MVAPIVTLPDLVKYQDGDAQFMIDQATAYVRSYCGWHVTPVVTETITLSGAGPSLEQRAMHYARTRVLFLPSLHVVSVASVTQDGALVPSTDYMVDPAGFLVHSGDWSSGVRSVVVTMTHGYDEAPDLADVILARASRRQVNPNAVTRTQAGPFSEQYEVASGFAPDELVALDRYRLHPRP